MIYFKIRPLKNNIYIYIIIYIIFDTQAPGHSEVSRTKPKITQTVCSWFGFTTLSKGGKEPIQSNPVGTRSTKFSFKISPVSVGRSGFERVVLVWRWCSLVFEKKYDSTIQYLQQVICCFGYWFCLPFCCRTTGANFAMIFRCICTPPLSRVATLPGSVGQRVEAARYISSHLQRW